MNVAVVAVFHLALPRLLLAALKAFAVSAIVNFVSTSSAEPSSSKKRSKE